MSDQKGRPVWFLVREFIRSVTDHPMASKYAQGDSKHTAQELISKYFQYKTFFDHPADHRHSELTSMRDELWKVISEDQFLSFIPHRAFYNSDDPDIRKLCEFLGLPCPFIPRLRQRDAYQVWPPSDSYRPSRVIRK